VDDGRQPVQRADEQDAVVPLARDPRQHAGRRVPRAAQVPLDVLAGRDHLLLLAPVHPVEADLGVQVNVDLIRVHRHGARQRRQRPADVGQAPVLPPQRPWAADRRLGGRAAPRSTPTPGSPSTSLRVWSRGGPATRSGGTWADRVLVNPVQHGAPAGLMEHP
jgi:hypothetical protein